MGEEEREEWRRGVERGRRGERIVGEWKGEGEDEEDDTATRIRAERGRVEGGKVNVRVMQQMLQDEYDEDLPLVEAPAVPQAPLTKKELLRERQRDKRRTGKGAKLKKKTVTQEAVQLRMGGLSAVPASRMGVVQLTPKGTG